MPRALLFRRLVDLVEGHLLRQPLGRLNRRDRRRQRRLPVVDVPDRADVHVRLGALELCLCHDQYSKRKRVGQQQPPGASRAQRLATDHSGARCDNAHRPSPHRARDRD